MNRYRSEHFELYFYDPQRPDVATCRAIVKIAKLHQALWHNASISRAGILFHVRATSFYMGLRQTSGDL